MKKFIVITLDEICTSLDNIPVPESYIEEGFTTKSYKWYPSGWGCRMKISKLSYLLDEKWNTEVWVET